VLGGCWVLEQKSITVEIDLGKYINVELSLDEAEKFLRELTKKLGYETQDVSETLRYLRNFDVFYEVAKKKFKDYLVPPKSMNDMIKGTVVVDKVRLIKEDGKKVVISLDRRVDINKVVETLKEMGYNVEVKRRTYA
jgi:biotin operon repressor